MKKLFPGIVALLTLAACNKDTRCISGNGSITSENRTVSAFKEIEADGSYDIYITQDSVQSVKVEAESNLMPRIKTESDGNKLHIYTHGCITRMKKIKVYISSKEINGLSLNGSGNIYGQNKLSAGSFHATIEGSGKIDVEIQSSSADLEISGSGDIYAKGTAENCSATISGSGNIKAPDLLTRKADVDISGSGDTELSVAEMLNVNISGSGNVYYHGSPSVNLNVNGSGKVIKR